MHTMHTCKILIYPKHCVPIMAMHHNSFGREELTMVNREEASLAIEVKWFSCNLKYIYSYTN